MQEVVLPDKSVVCIVTNEEEWEEALPRLTKAMGVTQVLGLDVECLVLTDSQPAPSENRNASSERPNDHVRIKNIKQGKDPLLQIAAQNFAVLVRLCFFAKLPYTLNELIENRSILKVGVEVVEDARRLRGQWKLRVGSCLDLRHVCFKCDYFKKQHVAKSSGLKAIGAFFNQDIDEKPDWRLVCSNWASPTLAYEQIKYAAQDALAAVGSYITILTKHFKSSYNPADKEFWTYFRSQRFGGFINRPYGDYQEKSRMIEKGRGTLPVVKARTQRRIENACHRSDSEVDMDFEKCRKKYEDRIPAPEIAWLKFYEGSGDAGRRGGNTEEETEEDEKVKEGEEAEEESYVDSADEPLEGKLSGFSNQDSDFTNESADDEKDEPEIVMHPVTPTVFKDRDGIFRVGSSYTPLMAMGEGAERRPYQSSPSITITPDTPARKELLVQRKTPPTNDEEEEVRGGEDKEKAVVEQEEVSSEEDVSNKEGSQLSSKSSEVVVDEIIPTSNQFEALKDKKGEEEKEASTEEHDIEEAQEAQESVEDEVDVVVEGDEQTTTESTAERTEETQELGETKEEGEESEEGEEHDSSEPLLPKSSEELRTIQTDTSGSEEDGNHSTSPGPNEVSTTVADEEKEEKSKENTKTEKDSEPEIANEEAEKEGSPKRGTHKLSNGEKPWKATFFHSYSSLSQTNVKQGNEIPPKLNKEGVASDEQLPSPEDTFEKNKSQEEYKESKPSRKEGHRNYPPLKMESPLGIEKGLLEWAYDNQVRKLTFTAKLPKARDGDPNSAQRFRIKVCINKVTVVQGKNDRPCSKESQPTL